MNDVLDQLERENFFNADVFIMPPENGDSDGDSENSDDEQYLARPFADHFTPQILKGEGSAEFVDEGGSHVLQDHNNVDTTEHLVSEQAAIEGQQSASVAVAESTSVSGTPSRARKKRQLNQNSGGSKRSKPSSKNHPEVTMQAEQTVITIQTEPAATRATVVVNDSLPRVWKKAELNLKQTWKFSWNKNSSNVTASLPNLEPSGYFELFWDNALFKTIQNFSKLYAVQQDPRSSFDVAIEELKVVVGILLISGYSTVPRRRLYWSSEIDVRNEMIANAMSRNRFDEILSNLHCANNAELSESDRFSKVRPVISHLNEKYLKHWPVSKELSVDESMIPYYGHHGCKQHIHGKPVRFGFKIWSLNTSTDGYCCQFEPYQGAGTGMKIPQLGLGGSVVVDLVSKLPRDLHYHIFADNFFSSLTLVDHLTLSSIGYTGTIRENRTQKCPVMETKKLSKLKRGEFDFRQDTANGLILVKWHDNAIVSVVSNCDGIEPLRSATRWSAKDKKELSVTVPDAVHQYNRFMGGTDLMDRNIANYRITIRMKKWWWSVFSFLVSSSVVNAWCIHRMVKAEKLDLLSFTRQIAISYALNYSRRPPIGRPPAVQKHVMRRVVPDDVRTSAGHYPVSTSQNRCRVCQKNTKRGCGKCGINLHDYCFMVFHNN